MTSCIGARPLMAAQLTVMSESPPDPVPFCSDLARQRGEPLFASAVHVDVWFLLEYEGAWTAQATADNDLPPATQRWLQAQLALTDRGRLQFIKRAAGRPEAGLTFFVALAREAKPLLYEFRPADYEALQQLDLAPLLNGDGSAVADRLRLTPLYLVCTNGKRDRCCARDGLALYQALAERVGSAAWQTTHLGGHRFAPTLISFPEGAVYGRLAPADVDSFIRTQARGRLAPAHLRGRSCYPAPAQAAAHFLRSQRGLNEWASFRLLELSEEAQRPDGTARWTVRFEEAESGRIHRLSVGRTLSETPQVVSCSPVKTKPVARFQLLEYQPG